MFNKNHTQPENAPKKAKVPVIMQMEALECGAACLAMISAYYGKWVPLEQVRSDCGVSRDGSNAKNIFLAAQSYGFKVEGYLTEPESLKKEGTFPCIIHWNFNHFVVLDGFDKKKAYLNDPARGEVSVSMDVFDKSFTGVSLFFSPGNEFKPEGHPRSVLSFARERIKDALPFIVFTLLLTIISSMVGLIRPFFDKIFFDYLLPGMHPNWVFGFLLALIIFSLIQVTTTWISSVYSLRMTGKLDIIGSSDYMWKVLRLPMEFFTQRMAGDIQLRKSDNASVASDISQIFAPLLMNTVMMVFYLVFMIHYSIPLTILGVCGTLFNVIYSQLLVKKRINIARVQMRDTGKKAGTTVAGIEMIESIKASGAENGFFQRWSGYQASVNNQEVTSAKLSFIQGKVPEVVNTLINNGIMIGGIYLTMQGHFTIGTLTLFQSYLNSFNGPALQLFSAAQTLQQMRTKMERIEDVMNYPLDPAHQREEQKRNLSPEDQENISYSKLSGEVELKNVTFGYSKLAKPLISDFSMKLAPGSKVAFVGETGCGKSTLSKLISGLYQPWSGEILFDGKPIDQIDHSVFTGSLAVVDQDIILFEDTIANNIQMWDNSIEDFEVILAARDAQIHNEIMTRDGGYQYKLQEGGQDFSGGQRQRLEIARVLAQDPTILIMDEATSALDAKTEWEVVKSINDRGITCIIIAHRLSTIRDCDEIIVLDHGKVVERGNHAELLKKGGRYAQLVTSE